MDRLVHVPHRRAGRGPGLQTVRSRLVHRRARTGRLEQRRLAGIFPAVRPAPHPGRRGHPRIQPQQQRHHERQRLPGGPFPPALCRLRHSRHRPAGAAHHRMGLECRHPTQRSHRHAAHPPGRRPLPAAPPGHGSRHLVPGVGLRRHCQPGPKTHRPRASLRPQQRVGRRRRDHWRLPRPATHPIRPRLPTHPQQRQRRPGRSHLPRRPTAAAHHRLERRRRRHWRPGPPHRRRVQLAHQPAGNTLQLVCPKLSRRHRPLQDQPQPAGAYRFHVNANQ